MNIGPAQSIFFGTWGVMFVGATGMMLVRRACYSWRDSLVDGVSSGMYRRLSMREREHVREVTSDLREAQKPVAQERNLGLMVVPEFLTTEESDFTLDELSTLLDRYGRHLGQREIETLSRALDTAGIDSGFLKGVRFISDLHEDERPPKGSWGAGDSIDFSLMPLVFRRLAARVQEYYPNMGEVRHIHVLHSEDGALFVPPRDMSAFAGHEYMVIPLARKRREELQGGVVFTLSPKTRSQSATLGDTLQLSYTTKDQDAYMPFRSATRVYASGRLRMFWGIRPLQYLGHPSNPLPLADEGLNARFPDMKPGAWGCDARGVLNTPMEAAGLGYDGSSGFLRRVGHKLGVVPSGRPRALPGDAAPRAERDAHKSEVALIMLGFEGVMDDKGTRNKWRRWEAFAYGKPPQAADFLKQQEDVAFAEEEVGPWYAVPLFVAKHFRDLGTFGSM